MHLDECGIDPILAKIGQVCHKIDKKIFLCPYFTKKVNFFNFFRKA